MEIKQANINEFYNFVQDQIGKITKEEGLDKLDINLVKNIITNLE